MVDDVGRSVEWLRKRVREEETTREERWGGGEREICIAKREKFNKIQRKYF